MNKDELQLELDLLLADKLINRRYLDNIKCINWAISLMERGVKFNSVDILAGLDINDSYAVENYIQKLIEELDLIGNKDSRYLFQLYILDIAQKVIARKLSPDEGLDILSNIHNHSYNYDFSIELVNQLEYLSESISLIGECQLFYTNLTEENKDEAILNEMRMLLYRTSKCLTPETDLIYCNVCNDFTSITIDHKRWLIKTEKYVCKKCKSTSILDWNNVINQKRILDLISKNRSI